VLKNKINHFLEDIFLHIYPLAMKAPNNAICYTIFVTGCSELSSDNIVNVSDDCLIHIACLFSAIIVHGAVPDSFAICIIVPIPKC